MVKIFYINVILIYKIPKGDYKCDKWKKNDENFLDVLCIM